MGEEHLKADEEKQHQDSDGVDEEQEEKNVAHVPQGQLLAEAQVERGPEEEVDEEEEEEEEEERPVRRPASAEEVEEYVSRLNDDKWPNVNGVYDNQGEWHEWNEMTYSYTYADSELIILPYTVCSINLSGGASQQQGPQQQLATAPAT